MLDVRPALLPVAMAAATVLAGCSAGGGHAEAKQLIQARCGSCHRVPGVRGAVGNVGPSLAGMGKRQVIAGHFPNDRRNLIRWILHSQEMLPGNAMPDSGLTPEQAGEVADYLYTLDK